MKKYINEKRIAIFTFLAVAAYCYMAFSSFAGGWDSFKLGYWMEANREIADKSIMADESLKTPKSVHWVSLKPAGGYQDFSGAIRNDKDGSLLDARFTGVLVALSDDYDPPGKVVLYKFIDGTLHLILFIILIVLPVRFTRLMLSIKKGAIFNRKNVNRIRSIGIMAILIYIHSIAHLNLNLRINQILFDIPDYIISRPLANASLLVVGTAVLVIAEILSKGLDIKTELELTI
jgi:hypothetical protein